MARPAPSLDNYVIASKSNRLTVQAQNSVNNNHKALIDTLSSCPRTLFIGMD